MITKIVSHSMLSKSFLIAILIVMCCENGMTHDTVKIREGKEVHDPGREREINDDKDKDKRKDSHWHFSDSQSSAWNRCIADTYDEENHVYRPEMCNDDDGNGNNDEMMLDDDLDTEMTTPPRRPRLSSISETHQEATEQEESTASTDSTSDSTVEIETYVTFPTPDKPPPSTDSTSDSTVEIETYVTFPTPDKPPPSTDSTSDSTVEIETYVTFPTPDKPPPSTDSTSDSTVEIETYVTFPTPDKPPPPPEKTIAEIIEEVPEELEPELVHFDYPIWRAGYNMVSFPVLEEGIETVADFYNRYPFLDGNVIYVLLEGCWYPYSGDDTNQIAGQVPIVPYLGVVLNIDYAHYLGVNGIRLEGDGSIDLKPGLNILGLSELPSRYQKPSDFLVVSGVDRVITRPSNSTPEGLSWYVISREGDSGDEYLLAVGGAILIFCSVEVALDMTETAPAAPSSQQSNPLTTWGAVKVRR